MSRAGGEAPCAVLPVPGHSACLAEGAAGCQLRLQGPWLGWPSLGAEGPGVRAFMWEAVRGHSAPFLDLRGRGMGRSCGEVRGAWLCLWPGASAASAGERMAGGTLNECLICALCSLGPFA